MTKKKSRLVRFWRWVKRGQAARYVRLARMLSARGMERFTLNGANGAEHRTLATFRSYYAPDRTVPYTWDEFRRLPEMEGCLNCGLCLSRCPAIRGLTLDRSAARYAGPRDVGTSLSRSTPDFWATSDTLFHCTLCGACEAVCPAGVPIPEVVELMRRRLYQQETAEQAAAAAAGEFCPCLPPAHRALQANLEGPQGNIFGQALPGWSDWEKPSAEYVLFAGCAFSYWERESLEQTLRLLQRLGVDFTTVDERCCGGPSAVVGAPLVEALAEHNRAAIDAKGTRRVITACPRCYLTLAHDPAYAGLEVQHTAAFLARYAPGLAALRPGAPPRAVTYHDPCESGRCTGEYDSPRRAIEVAGLELREMAGCRELSNCCGAGGGVRGAYTRVSVAVARQRYEEAAATGAEVLLTECPSCLHNFRNARRSHDTLEVANLSEYLGSQLK